jgi:hypothetical protein
MGFREDSEPTNVRVGMEGNFVTLLVGNDFSKPTGRKFGVRSTVVWL